MADIELVINIPEEIYSHTQEYEVGGFNQENDTKLFMAIKNGTPLPKDQGIREKRKKKEKKEMNRGFEFALKKDMDQFDGDAKSQKAYPEAKFPVYSTPGSAGADFFCAQEVTIPPVKAFDKERCVIGKPTLVHTGIKAFMQPDEALMLYNRSSNPKKLGLVLANGVGVVDSDYYGNPDNDGEIMFAFYNVSGNPVTLHIGDKIGQGVFQKFLRAEVGADTLDVTRKSGFGSTGR